MADQRERPAFQAGYRQETEQRPVSGHALRPSLGAGACRRQARAESVRLYLRLLGGGAAVLLQHRYLPESTTEFLLGQERDEWLISENGLRVKLDIGKKQNNGLFLDMRYGRRWVREHAEGKRVLNLFAYTCGFSVAAM